MRALVADPDRVPDRHYRRFIQRAQLEAGMADYLALGEPYLGLNALVLGAAEAALLERLTAAFSSLFQRAGRALAADVPRLVELGFPWVAAELLAAEPPRLPLVGRFDFVRDEGGHWWLLEFNADTPSGIREAVVVDRLVHEYFRAERLVRPSAGLGRSLVAAFRGALRGLPAGSALGVVTAASELEDLAQMAFTQELLRPALNARGIEVVLGDLDNLRASRAGLTICGRRVDALYRYVPLEAMLGTPAFAAVYEALAAGRLQLLNGLFGLLLQHKGVLAWLWQHRDSLLLAEYERGAIKAHLPPTWPIDACPPEVEPSALVAKQIFGREGEEIFFGDELPADDWRELRRRRTYVAQRRVRIAELAAAVPTSSGARLQRGFATVGSYAVDGRPAGYYTRFGGKVITFRAKWMATFTERGSAGA